MRLTSYYVEGFIIEDEVEVVELGRKAFQALSDEKVTPRHSISQRAYEAVLRRFRGH